MATIFISYSTVDWEFRDVLVPQIRNAYGDKSYWYDKEGLRGGDEWWRIIQNEIRLCQIFLFLMSESSLNSVHCIDELRLARQHGKQIIQVLLPTLKSKYPDCLPEDLREDLSNKQYVNLHDEYITEHKYFKDLSQLWGALNKWTSNSRAVLTTTERWILHNQFVLLQQITQENPHPDYDEDFFKNATEIVSKGYEWYYSDISQYIYTTTFPYSKGQEIANILDMFRFLQLGYENLDDKKLVDKRSIEFVGFDGNNETTEMQFARFMMNDMGTYDYLMPEGGINSHYPTLAMYRRMLEAWNNSVDTYNLSKDDLIRIGKARRFKPAT